MNGNIRTSERRGYAPARTGHDQARRRQTDHRARNKAKPAGLAMRENTCEANGSQVKTRFHNVRQGAARRDRHHHCLHGHCLSLRWSKKQHQRRISRKKSRHPLCQQGLPSRFEYPSRAIQCPNTIQPTRQLHHLSEAATGLYQPHNPESTSHTARHSNDKTA